MAEMSPARKRIAIVIVVVGGALIGERVLTLMGDDAETVEPVSKPRARARAVPRDAESAGGPSDAVRLDRLDARRQRLVDSDALAAGASDTPVFAAVSWQPPATKSTAAAGSEPPPKPVAPPFPYVYMGGLSEDGVRTSFFTQGSRVIPVKAGDTVDAVYRIDQMTEKQMKLTYLPLNESLVMAFGTTP